jgi:multicomponent Na+:H+ antiporter subunit B
MSPIVRTVCGWVAGFILLYGIQVVLYGHLTPGGGFSGGVIAASALVLILLAEGEASATETLSRQAAATLDSLGVLLFWLMPILGIVLAGLFFVNFLTTPPESRMSLWSGGIIPVCNVGIGLKVCSSLYLVVLVLTAVANDRIEVQNKEESS